MLKRDNYGQPPLLHSQPPLSPSPLDTNRSYRWTSMTAANSDKLGVDATDHDSITPEKKKADTTWWSPSRGDTWRLTARRGRTRDLAAAFDEVAAQPVLEFHRVSGYKPSRRIRRSSEPNYENEEKETVETNFIDDSMMEDHEEDEDLVVEIDGDYFERKIVSKRGEPSGVKKAGRDVEVSQQSYSTNGRNHRSTVQCVLGGNGDGFTKPKISPQNPVIDLTPRRPNPMVARSIHSLDLDQSLKDSKESVDHASGIATSTPFNPKFGSGELNKYFGLEESIRGSPMTRRERRGTQAIVMPTFDSPKSEKKFKAPAPPPPIPPKPANIKLVNVMPNVRSIANEIENSSSGTPRRVDAASEIAELRWRAAAERERELQEDEFYDENENFVDVSQESVPRVSHSVMKPSVQMGNGNRYKLNEQFNVEVMDSGVDKAWRDNDDMYAVPRKGRSNTMDDDENDEFQIKTNHKQTRQSLPFSDIPEERTYEKIDEMFDFVEDFQKTEDFMDKTTEMMNSGYAEMEVRSRDNTPRKQTTNASRSHQPNLSTHTYQELEFERSQTTCAEQFENDGTGFSGSSNGMGPQFTRSPTLMTPHAGQSVTEYRVSEKEGHAKTEKVIVNKNLKPAALATSTPKGTMATRNGGYSGRPEDSFVSSISTMSTAEKMSDSRKQISRLIEMIEKTRRHIQLAEVALIDAKKSRLVVQELSSQRVLLVCRERLKLQLDEVRRLQALSVVRHPPPPLNRNFKSTMVISNIAVHLNKNFNCRGSFAFIVALKCRTEIEATGVVTLLAHYQTRLNVIHFGEHLTFSNLPVDFVISMEVYMMRVPEYKPPEKTCASVLATKCRQLLAPSSAQRRSRSKNRSLLSLPGSYPTPECDFKFCGKLTLDRDSAGDRQYYLDDITYPLEGTVKLVSHCSSLPEAIDVEYRGFLYLFDERSPNGDAAWEKYWAMLHRGIIFFWKNPSDEKMERIPLSQIDLTKCTNQSIGESKNKAVGKHNLFTIELLIDQTPSLLEKKRVLLSAESGDQLQSWLKAINDTLFVLRS